MATYNTKQRKLILENMRRSADEARTIGEIRSDLSAEGYSVGDATIYRALALLVEEGVVEKLSYSGRESAAYRYINDASELDDSLILKCLSCGGVTRARCDFASMLSAHLKEGHSFKLDSTRTIVYGICGNCSARKENN